MIASRCPKGRNNGFFAWSGSIGILILFALLSLSGCMTDQRFEGPPTVLRDAVRNGEAVRAGDHVSIVTATRGELVFRVTEVNQHAVRGAGIEVPINDIVALQVRQVDVAGSAGGLAGWWALFFVGAILGGELAQH